jgi:hypothetical protein
MRGGRIPRRPTIGEDFRSRPAVCATSCCWERIDFSSLLFVRRKPFTSEQPFMDAHHQYNRPGGGIYRLEPVRPTGRVTPVVDRLGEGIYRDLCLHWDADRLLFAFGNGGDFAPASWDGCRSYRLYEVRTDGSGLRRLTSGPKSDIEPFYLPSGEIGFTSDRGEYYIMCGGDGHVANLFVMQADGSGVRQLSFNVFNEFNPTLLPDGRLLYGRWEYNERSVTSLHNPFTAHPDGSMVSPYYGNATIRPNVVMFPRPVPGSTKVMALFTAHHGQTHGAVGLLDVRRGIDGDLPLEVLTPQVPITGEKTEESYYGWFSDPQPLSETTWLCSYTPTAFLGTSELGAVRGRPARQSGVGLPRSGHLVRRTAAAGATAASGRAGPGPGRHRPFGRRGHVAGGRCLRRVDRRAARDGRLVAGAGRHPANA